MAIRLKPSSTDTGGAQPSNCRALEISVCIAPNIGTIIFKTIAAHAVLTGAITLKTIN
jgi:hypothetical protein